MIYHTLGSHEFIPSLFCNSCFNAITYLVKFIQEKWLKRTPLAIERDADKIFNILYSEENSSTLCDELESVEELELVFLPPNDGKDSDKDDASSDAEEGSANIKEIGRGVLSQSAEIRATTADEKKM